MIPAVIESVQLPPLHLMQDRREANLRDGGHYCINLSARSEGLQALWNHLGRWELLSVLIFPDHLSLCPHSSQID